MFLPASAAVQSHLPCDPMQRQQQQHPLHRRHTAATGSAADASTAAAHASQPLLPLLLPRSIHPRGMRIPLRPGAHRAHAAPSSCARMQSSGGRGGGRTLLSSCCSCSLWRDSMRACSRCREKGAGEGVRASHAGAQSDPLTLASMLVMARRCSPCIPAGVLCELAPLRSSVRRGRSSESRTDHQGGKKEVNRCAAVPAPL